MTDRILLGFEVSSGEPVYLPLHHLAIFGMTQLSGKTTALEALISRSGLRAIAFIVKRGEAGFTTYNQVTPYYKPRADWQFVEGLVNVALGEKVKYEPGMRYAIMKVCRGRKDLKEIQQAARDLAKGSKREFMKSVYEKLDAYLDIVIPELEKWVFTEQLELSEGVNVMDLSGMRLETQHIVIASTIEYAFVNLDHIIVIIPEAWETIPQSKMTPVKWVAQQFIRKGAALGNYLWLDSIPGYEAILVRYNGVTVEATNLESLYDYVPGSVETTDKGEEIKTPSIAIDVLGPSKSRLEWTRVKYLVRHKYSGPLLRLNTVGGVIDVSPNHPVMKIPCHIVPAEGFSLGERIASRDFEDGRLQGPGSHLFIGSNELAWLCGLFAAEGHVSGNQVVISNSNMEYLKRAQRVFKEDLHHSGSITAPRAGVSMLCLRSPRLALHFEETSYVFEKHGARAKNVPVVIMNGPKDVKESFLTGLFQGDGSFSRGYMRNLTSVSRPLLLGTSWLLKSTNFSVHTRLDKPDAVSLTFNKTEERTKARDELKKTETVSYKGYLYDLEVESEDHTFYLGIGNLRVHNSQDIGGIDKTPLRQCDNWLMGRMKEAHEVERILKQLLGMKIAAEEIQTLPLGHFYAAIGNDVKKVYVLPAGVPEAVGVEVAKGIRTPESVRDEFLRIKVMEMDDLVFKEKYEEEKRKREELEKEFARQVERISDLKAKEKIDKVLQEVAEKYVERDLFNSVEAEKEKLEREVESFKTKAEAYDALSKAFSAFVKMPTVTTGMPASDMPSEIHIVTNQPTLTIQKHTPKLMLDDSTLDGKIAIIYAEGSLPSNKWFSVSDVTKAFTAHGWNKDPRTSGALDKFCQWGFFEKQMSGRRPDYRVKLTPKDARNKNLIIEKDV